MIRAGDLNHHIILQSPNLIPDGRGGQKPGDGGKWLDVATVWAMYKIPRAQTVQEVGSVFGELLREIRIRKRADVKKGWRVKDGNQTFLVENVYDIDRFETAIWVKEVII